jgi:hypothetical protein
LNPDAIGNVAAFVRRSFDRSFVIQFELTDPRVAEITDRVISAIRRPPGESHPSDVYRAAWDAAKERDPDAFGVEEDGTEFIADPAWTAAFSAAVAYGYAEFISGDERDLLVRSWERVVGPALSSL